MMQERVDQRAPVAGILGCSRAGVNHHSRGLVDDGEVIVFVENVERNFLGDSAKRRALGWAEDCDPFATMQFQRRLGLAVIDSDLFFSDQLLDSCPAYIEARSEELVQSLAGVFI